MIFKPANLTKAEERNLCNRLGITDKFVFYAGGFDRRKNIVALTRAYLMLPEALRRNRQLVLAVDKKLAMDENPELETLINEASALTPAEDRVIFTGRIDDHTLVSLYSICELFVFPSQEGRLRSPCARSYALRGTIHCRERNIPARSHDLA